MLNAVRRLHLLAFLVCLCSKTCLAQEEAGGGETDVVESADDSGMSELERLIYVPFSELQKVLDNQDASAVVPYQQYMELLKFYLEQGRQVDESPDAVITEAHYEAVVEKEVVRIRMRLIVSVLADDGWSRLPLELGNVAVGKVVVENEDDTILKGVSNGKYELLLNGGGLHEIQIELLTAVKTSPEHRSFRMKCPSVGISDLLLTVPEEDQAIQITPLQVLLPVESDDDSKSVVKAALGSAGYFEARWNPAAGSRPVMDLLSSVSNQTDVRIEPGLVQSTTRLEYEILRGELSEVSVRVPTDARIIDVVSTSGRIQTWKLKPAGDGQQVINIELLTPVTDRLNVQIQSERTLSAETIQLIGKSEDGRLQGIHAEGVVRESGKITVTTDPSLTTLIEGQSGVKRIDAAGGGKGTPTGNRQAWDFSGTTGTLILKTRPVEPRLMVNQATRVVFGNDELQLMSTLVYTVEKAGVFELTLSYPDTLSIDTVKADGMSEFNVDKANGRLTLALTQKRLGQIAVNITGHQSFSASAEDLATLIPTITPEEVERENGTLEVFAPRFLDVTTEDEKTVGLFPAEDIQNRSAGRAVRVSSWRYTQRPLSLSVRTTPRPAQLSASVGTTVNIEPDVMKATTNIAYRVQNAGIDTFRVAVPEAISDDIRFRSLDPRKIIQQRDKEAPEDGWVVWTLVLQDEVTGMIALGADWEVPLDVLADETQSRQLQVAPVRVLAPFTEEQPDKRKVTLSQAKGEIRILRHESLSITAVGEGETIEGVDIRELELLPREGFLAFQYFSQPTSVAIEIRKHEIHEVVATVVSRAAIEVVTDKQSLASYRCRMKITSSERQRLLVYLPAGADLQTPLLNSRRTTFEAAIDAATLEQWDAYFVNVSRESTSDEEFLLTFQFRCPITASGEFPYEGQGSKQVLRLPLIGDDSGATVIQEVRTAVWSPNDISFVGEPRNWKLTGDLRWDVLNPMVSPSAEQEARTLGSWIGDSSGGGDFAQQGNVTVYRALGQHKTINIVWWNRPFLVAVICGALVFAGFILRRTSWENRLTLVLLGCLAVALWALKDGSETLQFVSAGSPGLIAVAGIWIVGSLLGHNTDRGKPSGDSRPSPPGASPPTPAPQTPTGAPSLTSPSDTPAAISPSPEVSKLMNDLMGGK